jgi:uncharacterized membrane protein (UPF0127 family)
MRRLWTVVVALLIGATACGYGSEEGGDGGDPSRGFGQGTVIIDKGIDTVLLDVEVAQTVSQRERGLMFRKSLAPDAGMVFIYFEPTTGGFWMKNTLIPLSIAFFGREGRILDIFDMTPCRRDPCRLYSPGVRYWGALEVNRGAFARWGVEVGDEIRLTQ